MNQLRQSVRQPSLRPTAADSSRRNQSTPSPTVEIDTPMLRNADVRLPLVDNTIKHRRSVGANVNEMKVKQQVPTGRSSSFKDTRLTVKDTRKMRPAAHQRMSSEPVQAPNPSRDNSFSGRDDKNTKETEVTQCRLLKNLSLKSK